VVTTWDAFGYYMYLPSVIIYHDATELKWLPDVEKKYSVIGDRLYQAGKCDNGNYAFNYFSGVAIMQSPFFLMGHVYAKISKNEQDGFSPPYQWAIALSALFYGICALFLLRKILSFYFNDTIVAITLLLLFLATNIIQYVSIDGPMSHSYIFFLYTVILYATIKWHKRPSVKWASVIGFTIGLATICRPTELIIFFIPLLWNTQNKEASKAKWTLVKENKTQLIYLVAFGFIAILPQIVYWKVVTGSFIYDVGSKWDFVNPHWRVLIGLEKGWFIYTPITIFFILGMFFIKQFPFRKSVVIFCLLNIWIVIAWHDWQYGASYSCRALVQSYPLFALPFAAFIDKIRLSKGFYLFCLFGLYLIILNFYQISLYNKTILNSPQILHMIGL
jgi:hypothetical protein